MNYEEHICKNLTAFTEIQNEVQIRTNNFEIVGKWLGWWPTIVYSFFVGSLSDEYGRKVAGHINPGLFNPKLKPRTFDP